MPDETSSIRVNFSKPFALFPLDGVVLLPHALLRLFIFEERYRQMVAHALDSSGQIAMAVFKGDDWKHEYHGSPAIERAVCVGQIVEHQSLPDGNYRVMLHGVCRALIRDELAPDPDILYRRAVLEPNERGDTSEEHLAPRRKVIMELLNEPPLSELAAVRGVMREAESREIPTAALIEVLTLAVVNEKQSQVRLLSEGSVDDRAGIVERDLKRIRAIMNQARPQWDPDAPSGVTWN